MIFVRRRHIINLHKKMVFSSKHLKFYTACVLWSIYSNIRDKSINYNPTISYSLFFCHSTFIYLRIVPPGTLIECLL